MSGEEGKTLARRYFEEVINQGNLAVADQIFAADYIDHSARPGSPTGPMAVKPVIAAFRAAFHELDETIEDMVAGRGQGGVSLQSGRRAPRRVPGHCSYRQARAVDRSRHSPCCRGKDRRALGRHRPLQHHAAA